MGHDSRRFTKRISLVLATALLALPAGAATAFAAPGAALTVPAGDGGTSGRAQTAGQMAASVAGRGAAREAERRGGSVRPAWPRRKGAPAPDTRLARWLARQVGPTTAETVKPTAPGRPKAKRTTARAAAASAAAPLATVASATRPLLLVRSFDIPTSSPDHARLLNYSWTYDNAVAVFAFLSVGARSQAEELLDQLRALQNDDGSLDFAYNVATGIGSGRARAGAMAWVGLAASAYRREYGNSRYDKLIEGVLDYLLALRTNGALVRGGTDVSWVSTQHNLLTIGLLRDVADQLLTRSPSMGDWSRSELHDAQHAMGNAVLGTFLRQNGPYAYLVAGVEDPAIPTDVQALGAMYLQLRGDGRATQVANNLATNGFLIAPRTTPSGAGPYSGFRPYLDATSPNVVWSEGTFQAALALKRLGVSSAATTAAVASLVSTTRNGTVAPIGADRDDDGTKWGEFHTWPTSAAASWLIVLQAEEQLLYAR